MLYVSHLFKNHRNDESNLHHQNTIKSTKYRYGYNCMHVIYNIYFFTTAIIQNARLDEINFYIVLKAIQAAPFR